MSPYPLEQIGRLVMGSYATAMERGERPLNRGSGAMPPQGCVRWLGEPPGTLASTGSEGSILYASVKAGVGVTAGRASCPSPRRAAELVEKRVPNVRNPKANTIISDRRFNFTFYSFLMI